MALCRHNATARQQRGVCYTLLLSRCRCPACPAVALQDMQAACGPTKHTTLLQHPRALHNPHSLHARWLLLLSAPKPIRASLWAALPSCCRCCRCSAIRAHMSGRRISLASCLGSTQVPTQGMATNSLWQPTQLISRGPGYWPKEGDAGPAASFAAGPQQLGLNPP